MKSFQTSLLLNLWGKAKKVIQKNPFQWSSVIFVTFFILMLSLWEFIPNKLPLLSTAVALISLAAGIRYGLFFAVPATLANLYFFTPENISISSFEFIMSSIVYAAVILFIVLSFGSQHAIEESMKRTLEKQNDWINVAGHELKTPISVLVSVSRLLKKILARKNMQEEINYVDLIEKSSWHLNKITSNLLDLSKLSSKYAKTQSVIFNPRQILNDVADLMLVAVNEKKLNFDFENFNDDFNVLGDDIKFQQIFTNLIDNAIKYTQSGFIKVRCKSELKDDCYYIEIIISDSGVGIPRSELSEIFKPFYRATSNHGYIEGSGLGLAICKRMIQQLNGDIKVNSKVGVGSEFKLSLSLPSVKTIEISEKNNSFYIDRKLIKQRNLRALLAEDHAINRVIIQKELSELNINVTICENGEQAYRLAEKSIFDFILLDCQMPIMDGFQAAKKIREYCRDIGKKTPPLIGFTADTSNECRQKAMEFGMDFLLYKPFHIEEILALIGDVAPVQKTDLKLEIERIFLLELPRIKSDLHFAMKNKDWDSLRQKIHYLKSSFLAIENNDGYEMCKGIENYLNNSNFNLVIVLLDQLINLLNYVSTKSNIQNFRNDITLG